MLSIQRAAQCLAVFCIVLALLAALRLSHTGVHVDTDLRRINPAIVTNPALNQSLDSLAERAAHTVLLLLDAPSQRALDDANAAVDDFLDERAHWLLEPDTDMLVEPILEVARQQRFSLLTPADLSQLHALDDQALLAQARRHLYGLSGQVGLFAPDEDPFGWLNNYVLSVLSSIGQSPSVDAGLNYSLRRLQLRPGALELDKQPQILAELQALDRALVAVVPDLAVYRSGIFMFAEAAAREARADISFISTGSVLGTVLLMLVFFRSLRPLVMPIASIACGVGFGFLMTHWFFGKLHILTLVFGASLVGVVIDYALHYFYFAAGEPLSVSNSATRRSLLRALTFSLLTSLLGYAALSCSGLVALQQVALMSGSGLIAAWLFVVCLGPRLTHSSLSIHDQWLRTRLGGVLRCLGHRPRVAPAVASVWVLMCLFCLLFFGVHFADSPRTFFNPAPDLLAQERRVSEVASDFEPATYVLVRAKSEAQLYEAIRALEQTLPDIPFVGIQSVMPSPQARRAAYEAQSRLYLGEKAVVPAFWRDYGLPEAQVDALVGAYQQAADAGSPLADVFKNPESALPPLWFSDGEWQYSLQLLPKGRVDASMRSALTALPETELFSVVERSTEALTRLREAATKLLSVALCLIGVALVLRYRSLGALRILLVPGAALLGVFALFGIGAAAMNLFHIMALFLVLGLGMDYVVFVHDMREHPEATLSAVSLSALTSLLSFGLLGLSSMPAVAAFGLTVFIGNSINFAGSIVLAATIHEGR